MKNKQKQPYQMTRAEWNNEREKTKVDGNPIYNSRHRGTQTQAKINRTAFLCYGVQAWLNERAMEGKDWALEAIEYNIYDTYEMIIRKATEEGKL